MGHERKEKGSMVRRYLVAAVRAKGNQRGVVLILVIWVMIFLSAIGLEFAFSMRTESYSSGTFRDDTEAYYAALAGMEQAKAEIFAAGQLMYLDTNGLLVLNEKAAPARWGQLGKAGYTYSIVDEERKLNLNTATQQQLVYLLRFAGLDGDRLEVVSDSILDWKDGDSNPRLKGAEESYYRSLSVPRSAKDGFFDAVEELLLVRGVTPAILYGEGKQGGIGNYLTVKSGGTINVNTASRPVLEAVLGLVMAEQILVQRKSDPVIAVQSGVVKSAYFTVISTGKSNSAQRTIKATIWKMDERVLKVLYWNDNWA
jgi:general secretion pathway protein K